MTHACGCSGNKIKNEPVDHLICGTVKATYALLKIECGSKITY